MDRDAVVHAEGECGRVHHLQATLDRLEVGELGQELGIRVELRVAVVDTDAVLRHQDRLGAGLRGLEAPAAVFIVKNNCFPAASGEDRDPSFLDLGLAHQRSTARQPLRPRSRTWRESQRSGARRLHALDGREEIEHITRHPRSPHHPVHPSSRGLHPANDLPGTIAPWSTLGAPRRSRGKATRSAR